jgi:diaminopimelate epimerase
MDMGRPTVREGQLHDALDARGSAWDVTILDVGNPQCVVFIDDFDFDWPRIGQAIESHPRFPARTNVSFVKAAGPNAIDVRFYERGVGVTNSSGTGSTGAMAAAVLRGLVASPVEVRTPAGPLQLSWENPMEDSISLVGPAALTAEGQFFFGNGSS